MDTNEPLTATLEPPPSVEGQRFIIELTPEQLRLIEAGVKLLLVIEDDHEAVHQLKDLRDQVRALTAELP